MSYTSPSHAGSGPSPTSVPPLRATDLRAHIKAISPARDSSILKRLRLDGPFQKVPHT